MRHKKGFNHLGRTSSHRKAMLSNMATSLIMHKRIATTTAKAKELRSYVEPLITKSKEDNTHSRRVVFGYLRNKYAVSELFREISPKVAERPGGYTRILKTGNRLGDNADMCIIELVDYNENMLPDTGAKSKSTRRRRGGKKKEDAAEKAVAAAPASEVVADVDEIASEAEVVATDAEGVDEVAPEAAEVETPDVIAEVKAEDETEASGDDNNSAKEEKKTE
ncbi:MAG: 50S ribosomal protein L17 [Bacteroidales bacterium]|nr:50S ribosomal protein L17 [Bacteroidales bacterium]